MGWETIVGPPRCYLQTVPRFFRLRPLSKISLAAPAVSQHWYNSGKFWVGKIHWLPTQYRGWVGNRPPCPIGSRATGVRVRVWSELTVT